MSAKIFISYSTVELAVATRAKRVLEAAGHAAYVAEYDARGGARLPDDIKRNIAECDIFTVLWSSNAKRSDWVAQEIGFAESHQKIIVPIVLESGLKPPGFISDRKYVDATRGLENAVLELKAIVEGAMKKKEEETGKAVLVVAVVGLVIAALSSK